MPRIDVEVNQAHAADGEQLATLLGQIRSSSEARMPGSWMAFCVQQDKEGKGAQLYWCIGETHDIAQAALTKAAQLGHLGDVGRFEIRTVQCMPEILQ